MQSGWDSRKFRASLVRIASRREALPFESQAHLLNTWSSPMQAMVSGAVATESRPWSLRRHSLSPAALIGTACSATHVLTDLEPMQFYPLAGSQAGSRQCRIQC